jgi:hypothetical protein
LRIRDYALTGERKTSQEMMKGNELIILDDSQKGENLERACTSIVISLHRRDSVSRLLWALLGRVTTQN